MVGEPDFNSTQKMLVNKSQVFFTNDSLASITCPYILSFMHCVHKLSRRNTCLPKRNAFFLCLLFFLQWSFLVRKEGQLVSWVFSVPWKMLKQKERIVDKAFADVKEGNAGFFIWRVMVIFAQNTVLFFQCILYIN